MPFILLAFLIPFVLINMGLASVRVLQLLETTRLSPEWKGHLFYAVVLSANAVIFLTLYATYLLHLWVY